LNGDLQYLGAHTFNYDLDDMPRNQLTRRQLEDELERARIRRANVTAYMVTLYLEDGRVVGMPTVWSPRLTDASEAERQNYEIIGHGAGLHWPDLDEYVSIRSILLGRRSAEGSDRGHPVQE
jgi:hypothetical protein